MASADKDGKLAEMFGDMHKCLVMSLHESIRENEARLDAVLAQVRGEKVPWWRRLWRWS